MNCQQCEKSLNDYTQGTIPAELKKEIAEHLDHCLKCRQLYREYEHMCQSLQALEITACPKEVLELVFDRISAKLKHDREPFVAAIWRYLYYHRLKFAVVSLALVLFAGFLNIPALWKPDQTLPAQHSQAEVEQAYHEVKIALIELNSITRKTHQLIEEEVMLKGVIMPFQTSMNKAFKPINNGDVS